MRREGENLHWDANECLVVKMLINISPVQFGFVFAYKLAPFCPPFKIAPAKECRLRADDGKE